MELKDFKNIPVRTETLKSLFDSYKSPINKISTLKKKGDVVRLKKDFYVVSEKESGYTISKELISNHLYGPSYISLETALAYYGLIPEYVYETKAATYMRAKRFNLPIGRFCYQSVPRNYFDIGISCAEIVSGEGFFLLATPEKTICDMILCCRNLRLQSTKAVRNYLVNDLRIEPELMKDWDEKIVYQCAREGRKYDSLMFFLDFIKKNKRK